VREKTNFASDLNAGCPVQSLAAKIFRFPSPYHRPHFDAVHSTKGRIAIVTGAELDAMDTITSKGE